MHMESRKLYRVTYRDDSPDSPMFTYRTRAYSVEHAELQFMDGPDAEGWVLVKIERAL